MSFELQKHRERLTEVIHLVNKEDDKIIFLVENLEQRVKNKEFCEQHKLKWEHVYQMGMEQTEQELKIREATRDKLINEIKFLRLIIQEMKEKLTQK